MVGRGRLLRPLATAWLVCALVSAGVTLANGSQRTCVDELNQLATGLPESMPTGAFAAQMLYGAVELVEPVLPPLSHGGRVPIDPEEAGYGAVGWLLQRDLLSNGWSSTELDGADWHEMLARFEAWYGLEGPDPDGSGDLPVGRREVIDDLTASLARVAEAVRPVAVIATGEGGAVEFTAVLWNWTSYPRLIVLRAGSDATVRAGPEALLGRLGNCAVRLEHYVMTSVDTAWRLFTGTGDAVMYVVDSEPDRGSWPLEVRQDDVLDYLLFEAAGVRGTDSFSAIFSGQELGLSEILALAFQVRTNVPVTQIPAVLAVPRR